MVKQQYQAYMSATHTVAKTRQVVMLYDGMIRCMHQAKEAITEGRIEDRYHLLVKTSDIVYGLQSALDFEAGGKIAQILYSYYSSIDSRIFSIHRSNSLEACDEIISDLKQMRDVWQDIDSELVDKDTDSDQPPPAATPDTDGSKPPSSGVTLSA